MTNYFEQDLQRAGDFHGHICQGIVFGVRMARVGLKCLGIEDPNENRDFIVFVEADRCVADAVYSVTGCSLGKRRLKWMDYGKMAASFVDMNTQTGVRIAVNARQEMPENEDVVSFWRSVPDEELFKVENISVALKPEDLPGKPLRRVQCDKCGEKIMDGRELLLDGKVLCKACGSGGYYIKK
ncbi:MAG: FmdE family protein [Syntrophomonadaceae bacterium]